MGVVVSAARDLARFDPSAALRPAPVRPVALASAPMSPAELLRKELDEERAKYRKLQSTYLGELARQVERDEELITLRARLKALEEKPATPQELAALPYVAPDRPPPGAKAARYTYEGRPGACGGASIPGEKRRRCGGPLAHGAALCVPCSDEEAAYRASRKKAHEEQGTKGGGRWGV